MRQALIPMILAVFTVAQSTPKAQRSNTNEDLRGVFVVSERVAWASGTHGTYLRTTDAGLNWMVGTVPGAEALDFRGVVAFSENEAFLMSSGAGDLSRIYHSVDGQHWSLQFTNSNPKGFFDSMAFWDPTHGVVVGDPIPDDSGALKFELLITEDGQTWRQIPPSNLPAALPGEGAFAASNSCIAIVRSSTAGQIGAAPSRHDPFKPAQSPSGIRVTRVPTEDSNIWFATGGSAARVFHSSDRGGTWQVMQTPMAHGPDSAGIFSIAFRDPAHGVIAGGNYKHPDEDGPNLAFTRDGGKTWTLSTIHPQAYFSGVVYDAKASREYDGAIFAVNPAFLFDLRLPGTPTRISPGKKGELKFNALSAYPGGGALFVGPKGAIITVSGR